MGNRDKDSDVRHEMVMGIVPKEWDCGPMVLASEIRDFLKSIKDEGTALDSGGGDGCADLWVTVGGTEYCIAIKKTGKPAL